MLTARISNCAYVHTYAYAYEEKAAHSGQYCHIRENVWLLSAWLALINFRVLRELPASYTARRDCNWLQLGSRCSLDSRRFETCEVKYERKEYFTERDSTRIVAVAVSKW